MYTAGPQYRVENKYDDFVKVMLRKYGVFSSIYRFYIPFPRSREHEIFLPLSIMCVDECASHVNLFLFFPYRRYR